MEWKVDRDADKPLYQQIFEYIEEKISYGEYPPGTLLPSERKLAQQLNVNRMTIAHVYDELQASGLVERKKGSGTRVSTHKWGILPKGVTNWRKYIEGGSFIPSYPLIRRIRSEAKVMENGYNLASGKLSSDLFPTQYLQSVLAEQTFPNDLGYEHPQGLLSLRETMASYVKSYHDINTTSSSVLITSGAQQALHLITQCLLNPGDAVAIEAPSYCYSLPLFQSAGLRIFGLPVDTNGVNPEDIVSLYEKHKIRMIFLNPTYHSPTGSSLSNSRRKRVLEISAELGIPIVEDDPVSLLSFDNEQHTPLKSYDKSGNVLYIGSLSKVIGSSLRIGWLIGPQTVINRLADAREQIDFGLSVFPQMIANLLLQSSEYPKHLEFLRQELVERRDEMTSALKEILGNQIEFTIPKGGLFIWCKINRNIDDQKLVEEGIKQKILFMPGSVYGSPNGYVRLTFAHLKKEEMREAVLRLADVLKNV
ncbi:MocR-like pyridoxine biosynthesis transcription factor PdxR [Bacillus tuaregi]|uniref:MocR-like pyridoxine biosynthesis transcription factor PdxR n=1 Tax=Bacillus tuaregi TaxID=1816695 RepID=UPI0008F8D26C|nr:PLP-dependent aminotransferase family protein [Bacillus tuaregi]